MTRAEAATYVGEQIANYLADVGRTATDGVAATTLKAALDAALRAMGYADADVATAAPTDAEAVKDFRLLAHYWSLALVVNDLGTNFDLSTGGTSLHLAQVRKNAEADLARLESRVVDRLGSVDGGAAVEWVDTGYLELADESYAIQYLGA